MKIQTIKRYFALFITLFFFSCSSYYPASTYTQTGLSKFLKNHASFYENKKALLITNHSGLNRDLIQNINLLRKENIIIHDVIAPEHGLFGYEEELSKKKTESEKHFGTTIYNMHKLSDNSFKSIIEENDFIIFDIQDMGMRCFTYITNLKRTIDILSNSEKELIIMDRPNPIAPYGIDGFYLNNNFKSKYISAFPAPLIYGLTIGEAANYYINESNAKINYRIIKMNNYSKTMLFPKTGLTWISPSPNLPTYQNALLYTAIVLLEGCNLSIGRGTPEPFKYIGAPWINAAELAKELNNLNIENFHFRPVFFKPKYSHYKNYKCEGVHIIYKGGYFRPSELSYKIIAIIKELYPDKFRWFKWGKNYRVDELAGTDIFRNSINQNRKYSDLKKEMIKSNILFEKQVRQYLLYP